MVQEPWEVLAEKARKYREESAAKVDKLFAPLPKSNHWGQLPDPLPRNVTGIPKLLLDPFDYEIVETDPLELVKALVAKKYTAVQVAGAYLRAAIIAYRVVNSVAEFIPELALERAQFLDKYLEEHGKPFGPLHGLPISVKEQVPFGGLRCNRAITKHVDFIAEEDAQILPILKNAGCMFYIRTTQPQSLMHLETNNHMFGPTVNPFNTDLTCGGSSGGEGASLGIHASCTGVGTDIGGSIRWPAAANGQYGLRPTTKRLPMNGSLAYVKGSEAIVAAIGPLTRTLGAAKLMTKVIIDSEPWKNDPDLVALPWKSEPLKDQKKLRIGILKDDGVVKPHPPVLRALDIVSEGLKKAGSVDGYEIELVEFEPYQHDYAWEIISTLYFEDGAKGLLKQLEDTNEPLLPLTKFMTLENPHLTYHTITSLWEWNVKKSKYREAYQNHWNSYNIDALIAPAGPSAAMPLGNSKYWPYTAHWNLLDYPSIVFPVTSVTMDDKKDESYVPRNTKDEFVHNIYSPEQFLDAPIALQLVGMRFDDEKLFDILEVLETGYKAK